MYPEGINLFLFRSLSLMIKPGTGSFRSSRKTQKTKDSSSEALSFGSFCPGGT